MQLGYGPDEVECDYSGENGAVMKMKVKPYKAGRFHLNEESKTSSPAPYH